MHMHWLQHVAFEGLGAIEPWARGAGCGVSSTRLYSGEPLPSLDGTDLLIVMGGPMSVNDEADHPWLAAEKALIRAAVDRGVSVLGVCLGAQLIAAALGARVYRNRDKEIGWFPIERVDASDGCFRFPDQADVFHWHSETFDLPDGAVLLARSAACENQAFQVGATTIGLQFHLEMTPGSVRAVLDNCRGDLHPSRFVQSESDLLSATLQRYQAANALLSDVLEYLTRAETK